MTEQRHNLLATALIPQLMACRDRVTPSCYKNVAFALPRRAWRTLRIIWCQQGACYVKGTLGLRARTSAL